VGGGRYEIIAGERRFRASLLAKLAEVPVIIREVDDAQALELALIENIQRADLNPLEEAAGYQRLMDEFRYTQEKLASVVGKSRSHIANLVRLLDLPEGVKKLVDGGKLSMGHARALVMARHPEMLAAKIVEEGLNVRQAEALVGQQGGSSGKTKPAKDTPQGRLPLKSDEVREIEGMLAENLGLKVVLNTRSAKSGDVVISYQTLAELDEVLRRLGGGSI
jgi:ParB family chromosome partitioning protein